MFKNARASIAPLLLASLLAFSLPLHAESEETEPQVRFSGFGSLGFVHNHGDGSAFIRDLTQPDGATNKGLFWEIDSRVGVQANYKPTENLEAIAQVISRYRIDNTFRPELTWGFLKYTPNDFVDLRAGRIGYDIFIGADSRDVGYSYLWVRPPVEFYGQLFNSYIDGGDVAMRLPLGEGSARAKLYSGIVRQQFASNHSQVKATGPSSPFVNGPIANLAGSRMNGLVLDYQDTHWTFKLGRTDMLMRVDFQFDHTQPSIASILAVMAGGASPAQTSVLNSIADGTEPTGKHVIFSSVGMAYENGPLQIQAAANHFTSGFEAFPPSNSGFVSAAYRIGKFTPYAVISAIKSKHSGRPDELASLGANPFLVELTRFALGAGIRNQHTYSLGMRYDFAEHAAVKVQLDRTINRTCSPLRYPIINPAPACAPSMLWPAVPLEWDGHATVFSAVLDFTF